MSQEMVKRGNDEIGVAKLGEIFAQSGYFRDVRDQAQAVVKILYGRELGFSPVVSMMGIHVIEGKPSLSSNLLGTLVKRSGKYDYRVKTSTDKECVLEFIEVVDGKRELLGHSIFTIDDAKNANLIKPNGGWMKYPKAMLFARALSAGIRLHCPDVSACPLYVPEELGATVDEEGGVTQLPKSERPMELVQQEVVLGDGGKMKAMQDAGIVPPAITEMLKPEESALERKLRESLEVIGVIKEPAKPAATTAQQVYDIVEPTLRKGSEMLGLPMVPRPPSTNASDDYISSDDAKAIHIHARSFLDKKYQKLAKDMVHAWCKSHKLVDEHGEGTLLKIKKLYVDADGAQMSGITRARQSLEIYMKERNAEKIAEETQAV